MILQQGIITINIDDFQSLIREAICDAILSNNSSTQAIPNLNKLLTRQEAAKYLSISTPTLSRYTKDKTIPSYRIGNRVLYKREELDQALSHRKF